MSERFSLKMMKSAFKIDNNGILLLMLMVYVFTHQVLSGTVSLTPEKQLFNENDDAKEKVATINAICNDTDCSNDCTVNDHTSVFEILGNEMFKKQCTDTNCGNCPGCRDSFYPCLKAGQRFDVNVTCSNYDDTGSDTIIVTVEAETPPLLISLNSPLNADLSMQVDHVLATVNKTSGPAIVSYTETQSVSDSFSLLTSKLFGLDTSNGQIKVMSDLSHQYSYTYTLAVTAYTRHQSATASTFIILDGCYQTPTCNNQTSTFNDQHEVGVNLFDVESDPPTLHFINISSSWQELSYTIVSTTLSVVNINTTTGEIHTTGNITVWPDYPSSSHVIVVEVSNSASCQYTSRCYMGFTVDFTNWDIEFLNIPTTVYVHEDTDARRTLLNIHTYDYNNPDHDNVTCDVAHNSDPTLLELVHDGNHTYNSYTVVKKECQDAGCGFLCALDRGCMNYHINDTYSITVKCHDAYNSSIEETITVSVQQNMPPVWTNSPKAVTFNTDSVAHLDVLFSIFYTDAENEILVYNYTVTESTNLFAFDPEGDYYKKPANITATSFQWDLANNTYRIDFCGTERRNMVCSYVTIQLRDYCGPTPTCDNSKTLISDEFPIGGSLFNITVSPTLTSFTSLTFVITSENPGLFVVDESTGIVSTSAALSVSEPPSNTEYSIIAHVYDSKACSVGACSLTVEVTFTNYNITITNMASVSVELHEDSVGSVKLHTIMTSDENGDIDSVTCEVDGMNSVPPNDQFETRQESGSSEAWAVQTLGIAQFDFDDITAYTVVVVCSDKFGSTATASMNVTILQNKFPEMTNLQDGQIINVDIFRASTGDILFILKTYDAENDRLQYTCDVENSWVPLHCEQDGVVSLRRNLIYPLEDGEIYSISLCINDTTHDYGLCRTLMVNVTSSRTRPVLINLPNATSLTEDSDTDTVVFVTSVFDPDVRDVHTFTMTVSPNDGSFSFDTSTGTLKVAAKLNYESQSSYTIFIGVKDQYLSAERTEALIVDVIDVNEEPSLTYINAVLNSQEGDTGMEIGEIEHTCTDPDLSDSLSLLILPSAYSPYFSLDNYTSVLSYALVWDFEHSTLPTSVTVEVACSDGILMSNTEKVLINIAPLNEFAPVLTTNVDPDAIVIDSQQVLHEPILTIYATDDDYNDDSVFSFHIVGIGKGSLYFRTNSDGELFIRQYMMWTYNVSFSFSVEVSDNEKEPLASSVNVTVFYIGTGVTVDNTQSANSCLLCTSVGIILVGILSSEGFIILSLILHAAYKTSLCGVFRQNPKVQAYGEHTKDLPGDSDYSIDNDSDTDDKKLYRPGSEMLNRALPSKRPPSAFVYKDPQRLRVVGEPPPPFQYHEPNSPKIDVSKIAEPGLPGTVSVEPIRSNLKIYTRHQQPMQSRKRRHIPNLINAQQPDHVSYSTSPVYPPGLTKTHIRNVKTNKDYVDLYSETYSHSIGEPAGALNF